MTGSPVVGRSAALAKRGSKQTCENDECGSHYYDLKRVPPACPYCGAACDATAVIKIDFETIGKQHPRKFNRWVEPQKPAVEAAKSDDEAGDDEVVDEQTDDDTETSSPSEDLLIEIEDEDNTETPVKNTSE